MRSRLAYRLVRPLASERGLALIAALGVSIVLGATVTSAIAYTASNYRHSTRSKADQIAFSLAEAGMNNALAQLYASGSPAMASALPTEEDPTSKTIAGVGRVEWYGVLQANVWTVVGVGSVPNPNPGLPDITRRVSTRVGLQSSAHGTGDPAVWNYVYADDPSGCTTIGNSSVINVPLYVRGGLCLNNSARVTGYTLQVGGSLTITGPQASVGTLATPINETHIAGGCSTDGVTFHTPCSSVDKVYAITHTGAPTGLTKPPVDLDYWYEAAAPGPRHPCTTGSIPGGGFDNDSARNASRPAFDLTPMEPYSCRVYDGSGNLAGELSWEPSSLTLGYGPGTLTVSGTIFIDGDVTIGHFSPAVYRGKATLYVSGRFSMGQQSSLCGSEACTTDWQPSVNLLALVAAHAPGDGVTIENDSIFQGAIYAVGDYRESNNSTVWGPIIADRIFLQNSTMNYYVPIGTPLPGMPAPASEEAVTLQNEAGSWGS